MRTITISKDRAETSKGSEQESWKLTYKSMLGLSLKTGCFSLEIVRDIATGELSMSTERLRNNEYKLPDNQSKSKFAQIDMLQTL